MSIKFSTLFFTNGMSMLHCEADDSWYRMPSYFSEEAKAIYEAMGVSRTTGIKKL